jgi:hypothetical protein
MVDKRCVTNKTDLKKKQQGGKATQESGPVNRGKGSKKK